MGAFNTVLARYPGFPEQVRVQFKFGDTWQHEYQIGDRLKWGGNDTGPKSAKYVVVDGCGEEPLPPGVGENFEVHIRNGIIEKVVPATGKFDFTSTEEAYVVIEE